MLKASFLIAVFSISACNAGSLSSTNNDQEQTINPDTTEDFIQTSDKDMGRVSKDVGISDVSIGEDTSVEDADAAVDVDSPVEGELMLFADVLANCDPQTEPTPNCAPAPPTSTGDFNIDCVNRVNQFRALCQCLPPLQRWTDGEQCAAEQSEYDSDRSQAHAGFTAGICNGGSGQNECPGYLSEQQVVGTCLQQMWSEGPGEPFSAHGHYLNMTNSRFSSVACGIFEGNNGTWAIQNFR